MCVVINGTVYTGKEYSDPQVLQTILKGGE